MFSPDKVTVPLPNFVNPPLSAITPLNEPLPLLPPTLKVPLPSRTLPAPLKTFIVSLLSAKSKMPVTETSVSSLSTLSAPSAKVPALIVVVPV